jgi:hypothetical protein
MSKLFTIASLFCLLLHNQGALALTAEQADSSIRSYLNLPNNNPVDLNLLLKEIKSRSDRLDCDRSLLDAKAVDFSVVSFGGLQFDRKCMHLVTLLPRLQENSSRGSLGLIDGVSSIEPALKIEILEAMQAADQMIREVQKSRGL